MGCVIDVKRPGKYTGPPTPHSTYGEYCAKHKKELFTRVNAVGLPEGGLAAAAGMGDPNTKILRELYIGNVPPSMTEMALQEFFNQQMKLRHLTKAPGNPCVQCRISNGFAFAEFRSVEETNLCAGQLNNVIILGAQLRVGRPKKYEDNVPVEEQQRAVREGQEGASQISTKMQDITCCLQLSNMLSEADLGNAEELAEIEEDITMELTKFGEVKACEMPKEGVGACKVYVRFAEDQQARVARAALQGRKFGHQEVNVWFYDPNKFDAKEWVNMEVEHGPAVDLMSIPLPPAKAKIHRASRMVRVHACY